ncbi:hypothetical protein [Variovorax sp. HJSM1_2]|uniref:hypothetical protein n=1 Tax=Variovorax sp. HJSM1_2 TaxID=3366263 RepID=UPI003BE875BB
MRLRHFVLDGSGKPLVGCSVEAVLEFKAPEKGVKPDHPEVGPNAPKAKAKTAAKSAAVNAKVHESKSSSKPAETSPLDLAKLLETGEEEGGGSPSRDLQLVLGKSRSDRCGYGVIDLGRLPKGSRNLVSLVVISVVLGGKGDLRLRVVGGTGSVSLLDGSLLQLLQAGAVDSATLAALVAAGAADARQALMTMLEDALAERTDAFTLFAGLGTLLGPAGHVSEPDATDYAFSPDSFVSRRDVKVGADGCEHLTPATLALRQYPIYHVVVHDEGKAVPVASNGEVKAAGSRIPSVRDPLVEYRDIRWGRILEFDQSWNALGHSLGEVKYSLPLAPGEAVKIAVIDWKRSDAAARLGANASSEQLLHEQVVDRDIDDIVNGNVSEQQSGESFMAGLAGAMDFQLPQFGISAAGRHSVGFGMSSTRGNRDVSAQAQNNVHLQTVQRSNLVRSQSSSVVVQATQAESNYLATRIIANMNRGHSLTVLYYEVLRHLAVRTRFQRADMAVLIPVETIYFTQDLAARFRSQLEPTLLNRKYAQGFEALERINAGIGDAAPPVSAPPTTSAPPPAPAGPPQPVMASQFEVTLKTGWRWNGQKYAGPADTAGHLRVIARMSDGSNIELVRLDEFLFPVVANFAHIFDFAGGSILGANNKLWTVSYDSPQRGFCFATCTGNIPAIDLRKVQSFAVEWTPNSNLVVDVADGWNLQEVSIRPMLQSGAFLFGYFQFTNSTGELFRYQPPPRVGLPVPTQNQGVALVNTDKLNPAPEPAPAPTPAASPAPATPATSASPGIDSHQWVRLLMHHLNTNQHYYSAQVWLNMDARERRLRLAPMLGPLLAGLGEVPLALSGNHLAFRYSGEVPADVAARLPELKLDLKATETVVTLPTRGIFAEAHLGHCNAAEKRDITRLWNFEELPVSLLPNIEALTAGPRGSQATVTPDSMGDTSLSVQDTPALPAAGEAIAQALELLAKPDIFRDQSTREQVAEIMGKLIESAQPPKLSGSNIGSAIGGGSGGSGSSGGLSAPPMVSADSGSSAGEWSNPFGSQVSDTSGGESFLAEKYRNYRLTDDSDRFQLAPELAKSLSGSGMSQDKVDDVISGYVKGTSGVVKKVPATATVKPLVVSLNASVDVVTGVKRALNGNYTITFSPPGDQQESPTTGLTMLVRQGSNAKRLSLPPDVYTVRADYVASSPADLALMREPQSDSLGINGQPIVEWAMDMFQRDLASQMRLGTEIEAATVTVDSKTTHVPLVIKAVIVPSPIASAEMEFTQGSDFTLTNANKVQFNSAKLSELATALFGKIKAPQAAAVAGLLSLFTIESSIGLDGQIKAGSNGKVVFKFTPYILREIKLE